MGSVADEMERRNKSVYINSATTTLVKTGEGILVRLIMGVDAGSGTAEIYDNTSGSGAKIASVETAANNQVGSFEFDVPFSTGLTVVTDQAAIVTIVYK